MSFDVSKLREVSPRALGVRFAAGAATSLAAGSSACSSLRAPPLAVWVAVAGCSYALARHRRDGFAPRATR